MKTIYLGKSYSKAKIASKKPKTGVRIGSTSHYTRYAVGDNEYLVAKKGYKLRWDK